MLKNTFFVVSSGVTTVVSTLLALEDDTPDAVVPAVATMTPCDLTEAQIHMVHSVMHARDPMCTYNVTLDAVLAMGGH